MKKILIYEHKHFGVEDICEAFKKEGYVISKIYGKLEDVLIDKEFGKRLERKIKEEQPEFIFSFNYYPVISEVAKKVKLKYVSWVYDSPLNVLYSYTIINECNYIFIFDYATYEELRNAGITTVYYLPLAVNTDRLQKIVGNSDKDEYKCDISFVGSLYKEEKHALYDRLYKGLDEYTRGYLDAIIRSQYDLYGCSILKDAITKNEIIQAMQKSINITESKYGVETPEFVYAEYFLARKVTELERVGVMEVLPKEYDIKIYTHDSEFRMDGIRNMGRVDYYDGMPFVFGNSKINLNITLKSIKTGIPLRIFDIMGCGGFLLTNYQSEMQEYFIPFEDYVCYDSIRDISELVKYYLTHDDERERIAMNGFNKVKEHHSYDARVKSIFEVLYN